MTTNHFLNLRQSLGGCIYRVDSIRSDATNAKVLHTESLHVTFAVSRYCYYDQTGSYAQVTDQFVGDLLVQKSKTAGHCLGMVTKQLRSVGAPVSWQDDVALYTKLTTQDSDGNTIWKPGVKIPKRWNVVCNTTDAGSDQVASRDMIAWELSPIPWCLYFELSCFLHQLHILDATSLKRCGGFIALLAPHLGTFFGTLATISNTWREVSAKVREWWTEFSGPADGKKFGNQIPPRCLSGRWASHIKSQMFLLNRPPHQLTRVLLFVVGGIDSAVDVDVPA